MSLALQPALADDLFGNHPLTPEARDAFVTELLKKMTVDEKIGQLRLISVGPDNPKEAIREMIKNGQVATQYVDLTGTPTMDQRCNPNGSVLAIEGITSPDGRVFGKMGHSERSGEYLYKNVTGDKYQPIFEGGVDYFKV